MMYLTQVYMSTVMWMYMLVTVVNLNLYNYTLLSNILDWETRTFLNDFFMNNFYFFWTSLWYLYFFFTLMTLIYTLSNTVYTSLTLVFLFMYFMLFTIILFEYVGHAPNVQNAFTYQTNINPLLLNSVNKVHPFLVYISLFFFSPMFYTQRTAYLQVFSNVNNTILLKNKFFVFIMLYTLFLGSWWAQQEGSWGGWWNWDASEVFAILILYKILNQWHVKIMLKSNMLMKIYTEMALLSILIFYWCMQLNFNLISHNFGFSLTSFTNTEISISILLFVMSTLSLFKINKYNKVSLGCSLNLAVSYDCTKLMLVASFVMLLLFPLVVLLNDFTWNNFNLNLLNTEPKLDLLLKIMGLKVLSNLMLSWKFNLTFLLLSYCNFLYWILSLKNILHKSFWYSLLHYIILLTLMYNLQYGYIILSNWTKLDNYTWLNYIYNLTFNANYLELNMNNINLFSSLENKSFYLVFSQNNVIQEFYPTGFTSFFKVMMSDFLMPVLMPLSVTILIIWTWTQQNKARHY